MFNSIKQRHLKKYFERKMTVLSKDIFNLTNDSTINSLLLRIEYIEKNQSTAHIKCVIISVGYRDKIYLIPVEDKINKDRLIIERFKIFWKTVDTLTAGNKWEFKISFSDEVKKSKMKNMVECVEESYKSIYINREVLGQHLKDLTSYVKKYKYKKKKGTFSSLSL